MSIEKRIKKLHEYKDAVLRWYDSTSAAERRALRSLLNQNKAAVQRDVLEAGCLRTVTVSPPPAVGGLLMRNVDPFTAMFNPPYNINLVPVVLDMLDEAIGIMGSPEFAERTVERNQPVAEVESEYQKGYVFIAMPMSPDTPVQDQNP